MKLVALKGMPVLNRTDSLDAEDFLKDLLACKRTQDFTADHFSTKSMDYLETRRKELNRKSVTGKPTVVQLALQKVIGFNVDLNLREAEATISIFTENSALSEVKVLLINALSTSSKLNEVKGKFNNLQNSYVYKLKVDMFDGAYYGNDKLPSSGILRLITLVDILTSHLEKV